MTHHHRNGCLGVCHRGNMFTARRKGNHASNSILLKETQGPGAQLRYPRQGATGNCGRTVQMGYLLRDNGTQNHDSDKPQEPRILENKERPQPTASPVRQAISKL